jgi:hypothetical protein
MHDDSPDLLNQSAPKSISPPGRSLKEVPQPIFSLDAHSRSKTFARPQDSLNGAGCGTSGGREAGTRAVPALQAVRKQGSGPPETPKFQQSLGQLPRQSAFFHGCVPELR